jgi:hypothetical protein
MRRSPASFYLQRIDYWFWSGTHARSFLWQANLGELVELPLTWYEPPRLVEVANGSEAVIDVPSAASKSSK